MFGLGDKEHNRKVRELRQNRRKSRNINMVDMDLWGIWLYYAAKEEVGLIKQSVRNMGIKASKIQSGYFYEESEKKGELYSDED